MSEHAVLLYAPTLAADPNAWIDYHRVDLSDSWLATPAEASAWLKSDFGATDEQIEQILSDVRNIGRVSVTR